MESPRTGGKPWGTPVLAAILTLAAAVYLLTMPVQYAVGDPAAEYARAAQPGDHLVRPHHLLTTPLNRAVLLALPHGTYRAGLLALQLLQILAILLAGLGLHRLLRRAAPEASCVLPALLLLFFLAHGVWTHAVTIETGMVPLALLIASLSILAGGDERASAGRTAAAGAVFALGVLFALQQALLIPAFLALVALRRQPRRAAHLLVATGAMLLVGAVSYGVLAVRLAGVGSLGGFLRWLSDHPQKELLAHLTIGPGAVLRSLSGFLNLLVDSRGATTHVRLLLAGGGLGNVDPLLLGRLAAGAWIAGLLLALAWIGSRGNRAVAAGCWLAMSATLLFGMFWLGSDPQFWLPAWPFVLLLAARGAGRLERTRWRGWVRGAAWATAATLPLLNLPVLGPSLLLPSGGPRHRTAVELAPLFRPGDVILHPGATQGDSWVSAAPHLRRGVRVVSLSDDQTFHQKAAGFRDELSRWIDDRLRERRRVYVDGLVGPPRLEQVGPWEIVKSYRGCGRSDLAALLRSRYDVRLVRTSSGERIAVIHKRKASGHPQRHCLRST